MMKSIRIYIKSYTTDNVFWSILGMGLFVTILIVGRCFFSKNCEFLTLKISTVIGTFIIVLVIYCILKGIFFQVFSKVYSSDKNISELIPWSKQLNNFLIEVRNKR